VAARSKARKRALDVLYVADLRGLDPRDVLADTVQRRADDGEPPLNEYVATLVEGVSQHRERIDELLSTYSLGWTLSRMPAIDRNVLRIGTYELLWASDIPPAVAIDEAVDLCRSLSTDESPAFVNGLLARLLEVAPTLDKGA
jgi:N utilization substance protein B